jgi:hypothetical protein
MASNLRVDSIVPATGSSVSIGTATGGVNIPGVLTYEDVTNVDSIGVITARSGIDASSNLILKTGGIERLRIQSDGDVGIGTINNTNNERLRVQDDASTSTVCQLSIISGSAERSILNFGDKEDPNIGRVSYHNNTNTLSFFTDNTERFLIDSSGHLHTGYTSSFGTDHINILASDGGGIAIASNNAGNATAGDFLGSLSFQGYLNTANYSSAEARISGVAAANHTGSSAATDMVFYTKPSSTGPGSAPTERLRIATDGQHVKTKGATRYNNSSVTYYELPVYFDSGTTHTVFTISGSYDSGFVAFATLEYIGLYGYSGINMSGGVRRAYTRRTNNNTQWRDFDNQVSENYGENHRPDINWVNGVLQVITPSSTQVTGYIRLAVHANSQSNYTVTLNQGL